MEESKLNEYIDTINRYGAHGGFGGLGTASFDNEEECYVETNTSDPKYELYKHFVKPGYKKCNKRLIVFDEENEKTVAKKEKKDKKKEKKGKKEKKDRIEKKGKKEKKDKKEKKEKKEKKDKKEKKGKEEKRKGTNSGDC